MSHICELKFEYDAASFVKSAYCSICSERMPTPNPSVTNSADRVLWFAQRFIEHKKQRHSETENELPKAS
jgi:transcription elongation factor Elf1